MGLVEAVEAGADLGGFPLRGGVDQLELDRAVGLRGLAVEGLREDRVGLGPVGAAEDFEGLLPLAGRAGLDHLGERGGWPARG